MFVTVERNDLEHGPIRLPALNPGSACSSWGFWISNLTSLCLNFLHCKMGITIVPASQWSEHIEQCLVNIVTVMMASVTEAYSRKAPEQR